MNNVSILVRLCKDVEIIKEGLGKMSVVLNERAKVNGEWEDKPVFIDVTVFGKQADNCAKFLSKGSQCAITGKLDFSKWTDKDGNNRSKLSVIGNFVDFVGNKGEASEAQKQEPVLGSGDSCPF